MVPVKFRDHVNIIERTKPAVESRLNKVRLDKNERVAPFPDDFWQETLKEMSQATVQACPETWPLYRKLADFHNLGTDRFLITSGSEIAIRSCIEAFTTPGGKVIYPDPTFAMVSVYCDLYQAEKNPVGYDEKLDLKIAYFLDSIDDATSLIILANPNSPTGTYVSNQVVEEILKKALRFRVPVLIDEAYYGFCPHTACDLLMRYPNLIVTRSFSKVTGMAGLRVGYAMGDPVVISVLTKYRPMYEANSVGIYFALKVLDNWSIAEEYGQKTIEGRQRFVDFLRARGFPVINTEANFMHVDFGADREFILKALDAAGILVRGMLPITGFENYTRFSVGPWDVMSQVADEVDRICAGRR